MGRGCSGKETASGKGRKKTITPEESGFSLENDLYTRSPQSLCGVPAPLDPALHSKIEIGLVEKAKQGSLPRGETKLEVLCTRQTLLGNPFRLHAEDEHMRALVCDLYENFLESALAPRATGDLLNVARSSALRLEQRPGIIGKDWAVGVGSCTCEDFQQSFSALERVFDQHDGSIRLLCHCVPLRCHTFSIARKLSQRKASATSTESREQASTASRSVNGEHEDANKNALETEPIEAIGSLGNSGLVASETTGRLPTAATSNITVSVPAEASSDDPISTIASQQKQRRWGKAKPQL